MYLGYRMHTTLQPAVVYPTPLVAYWHELQTSVDAGCSLRFVGHYDSHVTSGIHRVSLQKCHVTLSLRFSCDLSVTSCGFSDISCDLSVASCDLSDPSCIFTKICHVTLSCQWYSTWRSTGHVIMWWGHTGSDAHKQPLQQPGIVASGYKR